MSSWLFAKESLVDFLTFCFALNTMFSFSRVRRRFLFKLQRDLREKLRPVEISEEDCKSKARELFADKSESCELDCLKIHKCAMVVEDTIAFHRKILDKISCVFQHCFSIFAFLTGVIIVFSGSNFVKQYYYWSLFLLLPTIIFLLFWSLYPIATYKSKERLDNVTKEHLVTLDVAQAVMKEISEKQNNKSSSDDNKQK